MAHGVLEIPISTAASESAFSTDVVFLNHLEVCWVPTLFLLCSHFEDEQTLSLEPDPCSYFVIYVLVIF